MNAPRIVVVGSSNTDMSVQMDRLPQPGETVLGGAFATAAGGKGANQAVAAARAGAEVTFVARVGRDELGDRAVNGFLQEGIRTECVFRDKTAPSGVALIFVDANGANSIAVASGANARLTPADVRKAKTALAGAGALLVQLETPMKTVCAAVDMAVKAGVPVILNPAPAQPLPDALLQKVAFLTPNETEAALLTGIPVRGRRDAKKAAEQLMRRGARGVIITLGSRGVLLADAQGARLVRGFEVKAVDTTAAGDTFNGALAVALAEGKTPLEAVRFAQAAAALSVTRPGAQESAPRREEIERFIRRAR
ncbi:MAG: ribokinase [Chthoniobacteraceae bacterium]|nr:ribokinase [Chthoniobacteraceae bacterium]